MKAQEHTVKMNMEIRASNVRVIDSSGEQLGIITLQEAIRLAEAENLDLVEINGGEIPVCKILDWGKEQYRKKKLKHLQQVNSKKQELKELYLRPVTGKNDIQIKINKANEFLNQGHKVKIGMKFQGREITYKEVGIAVMEEIMSHFENRTIEHMPFRNNQIQIIVSPGSNKAK